MWQDRGGERQVSQRSVNAQTEEMEWISEKKQRVWSAGILEANDGEKDETE